jgi:hypothetical protein
MNHEKIVECLKISPLPVYKDLHVFALLVMSNSICLTAPPPRQAGQSPSGAIYLASLSSFDQTIWRVPPPLLCFLELFHLNLVQ